MGKGFKRDWIVYNSFASIGCLFTMILWPITATIFVIMAQVILLKRYLGWRSLLWILNPPLVLLAFITADGNMLQAIIVSALMIELVFYITIGKFSYLIWTLIVGLPASLYVILVKQLGITNDAVQIAGMAIIPLVIWYLEAQFLSLILKKKEVL